MKTNIKLSQLQELVAQSGNCVNLGRHIEAAYPALYQWVLDTTKFLNTKTKVKFTERVYCLLNNITSMQLDAFGNTARFVNYFNGYCLKVQGIKFSAAEKLQLDYKKAEVLQECRNIKTYYVWEDTSLNDVERILCLLKTQIMKS